MSEIIIASSILYLIQKLLVSILNIEEEIEVISDKPITINKKSINVKQNKDLVNNIFTDDFKNELKEKIRIKLQASYDSGVVDGGRLCKIKLDSLIKVIYQKNILIDSLKK